MPSTYLRIAQRKGIIKISSDSAPCMITNIVSRYTSMIALMSSYLCIFHDAKTAFTCIISYFEESVVSRIGCGVKNNVVIAALSDIADLPIAIICRQLIKTHRFSINQSEC